MPEEQRTEAPKRRRQHSNVVGRRLAVNESILDFDNFNYRYINDTPARMFAMTKQDDWDIVRNDGGVIKEDSTDLGDAVSVIVGAAVDGSGLRAYLCRKPRKFWAEDQKQKQEELDKQLSALRKGESAKGESQGDYVPNSGISIA